MNRAQRPPLCGSARLRAATVVACLLWFLASAPVASAQLDTGRIQRQGAVDGLLRTLIEGSPDPGVGLVSQVVASDSYAAEAAGTRVLVTTRFLAEASANALAAAVARDLLGDPVDVAITMHRAGLDGPAGLAELFNRLGSLVGIDSQQRAAVEVAYAAYQSELGLSGLNSVARDGYQVMAQARIQGARARYEQAMERYRVFRAVEAPRYYAMRPVPLELVQSVSEITAVLGSPELIEASPWGPRIKVALQRYGPPAPPEDKPAPEAKPPEDKPAEAKPPEGQPAPPVPDAPKAEGTR